MANPINRKAFDVLVRTRKSFNLLINDFKFATTILFRIRNSIAIAFVSSLVTKFTATINSKRIRILISQVKLITSLTQTINAKRVSISYVFRQRVKSAVTMYLKMSTTFVMKSRQKLVTTLSLKRITMVLDPILATFYTLGNHDSSTLGTLDTKTLEEMDYLIA